MMGGIFPSVFVPELPSTAAWDWGALKAGLAEAPLLHLDQAWRPSRQETFRPATVRLGWQQAGIIVAASLEDESVFTRATADNQRLWELGDVFEMFLRNAEREDYLELHVAPGDKRLQLRFPSWRAVAGLRDGVGRLEDFTIWDSLFDFQTRRTSDGWSLAARIPGCSLGFNAPSLKDRTVLASFSRYDYVGDGSPPVLSSTSPHTELDFHRQEEWTRLVFA